MGVLNSGVIPRVIRCLCGLPLILYSEKAINHWNFVKKHAGILLGPPLNHKIQVGEQFAGSWVYSMKFLNPPIQGKSLTPSGCLRVCLELCHVDSFVSRPTVPLHRNHRRLDSRGSIRCHEYRDELHRQDETPMCPSPTQRDGRPKAHFL
jgi:hypothetical protein